MKWQETSKKTLKESKKETFVFKIITGILAIIAIIAMLL